MSFIDIPRGILVVLDQSIGTAGPRVRRRGKARRIDTQVARMIERPDVVDFTSIHELGWYYQQEQRLHVLTLLRTKAEAENVIIMFLTRSYEFQSHRDTSARVYIPNLTLFMGRKYHPAHDLRQMSKYSMLQFITMHFPTLIQQTNAHFQQNCGLISTAA
jgi:hypothetical protein